ncbi:MAG: transcription-repair coupling factor [Veillonellaceae bacterium]|jgi:transcription-repair coupling factor (superfamily II helicase)|nr:transcription-repair coupling factor [Veillonellaceae bacterium]
MKKLFEIIAADQNAARVIANYRKENHQTWVYGLTGPQKTTILAATFAQQPRPLIIVTANRQTTEKYLIDFATLLPGVAVFDFPSADITTFTADAKSLELQARRMEVLGKLAAGQPIIVLSSTDAVIQKTLPRQEFEKSRITIVLNDTVKPEELISRLVSFGYERVDRVDNLGQFSVRGGIIDIFPINRSQPVRLELFGDEIDSLREFDAVTQRSSANLDNVDILPLTEPEHSGKPVVFLSYLPADGMVVFDEPTRIREQITTLIKENPELKKNTFSWSDIAVSAQQYGIMYLSLMLQKTPYTKPDDIIAITAKSLAHFHRQLDILESELKNWQDHSYHVLILMSSTEKAKNLQQSLSQQGLRALFAAEGDLIKPGSVTIATGIIEAGFELPQAKLVVITEMDIFGRQKKRPRVRVSKEQKITYFRDIKIGDYVVHINHGIGKYVGVETLEVAGVNKDYLLIRYSGEDKLYVPTDQVHLLQKYIGSEGETPRLSKMGGTDWLKATTKAKAAVADLAKELIKLYAERQVTPGYAFNKDTPWQREFEDAFPFEETPDQLHALAEIKKDMEQPRPMDRLLCGDVGFGKTEVAIRAAFKAVMSGKQVAVLVPTTVLAQQHYQTFSSRFAGFGPVVDMVSRFRSAKEQRETIARVNDGRVDVLIGTHRILQSDIIFKDLGLLIVDEEQRFGVAQKEKLKKWSAKIDVLTLSATPIPRTLHMSLVGARDMSIIETPPEERFPVQTYVVEYSDDIIKDAIKRELKRGGQVYFVYNRVQTIDKIQRQLAEMLPDAKVMTAHGQMPEEMLENVMVDFYENHYDVMVCTSIIENGLDVPNANTIIVYDADRFGLSQLYQMRGRVGRSHRMAYAYFTYRKDKVLTEIAEKRLQAIKEFAELGAGFKIAMRDLEIRGAGNLLGAQQHGHIVSVGFEMYCRLLDEAVHELKTGKKVEPPVEPSLELNLEAYLPGDYISDAMHKIEIYQRIAAIRRNEHIDELLDELIDRFGDPPQPVLCLLNVAKVKNVARKLGILSIAERPRYVELVFDSNPKVDGAKIIELRNNHPRMIIIHQGPPSSIRINTAKIDQKGLLKLIIEVLEQLSS